MTLISCKLDFDVKIFANATEKYCGYENVHTRYTRQLFGIMIQSKELERNTKQQVKSVIASRRKIIAQSKKDLHLKCSNIIQFSIIFSYIILA